MEIKTIENSKGIVEIHDEIVVKKYKDKSRNRKEFNFIKNIHRFYQSEVLRDIKLDFVKPINLLPDETGFTMNKIDGMILTKAIIKEPKLMLHIGNWIQSFHKNISKCENINSFGDFHLNNGFFDDKTKTLTFFDPNPNNLNYPEYDVISMLFSVIVLELKKLKLSKIRRNYFICSLKINNMILSEKKLTQSLEYIVKFKHEKFKSKKTYLFYFIYIHIVKYKIKNIIKKIKSNV